MELKSNIETGKVKNNKDNDEFADKELPGTPVS